MPRARETRSSRGKLRFLRFSRAKMSHFWPISSNFWKEKEGGKFLGVFSIFGLKMSRLWFFEKPKHFSKNTGVCFKMVIFRKTAPFFENTQFFEKQASFSKSALCGHFLVSKIEFYSIFETFRKMTKVGHFCQNRQKAPDPPKTPPVASSFGHFDFSQN